MAVDGVPQISHMSPYEEDIMETSNHGASPLARVGWSIAATIVGVTLTLIAVVAVATAQASNFDSSYKTGPRFAKTNDVVTYTIVAVNTGGPVTDVLLSDPVPNRTAFVPNSCTYRRQGGASQTCGPPPDLWQQDFAAGDRITTTFAVQVTDGTMGWSLVNCAYLNWDGNQKVICTTTAVNPGAIYLPIIMRNFPPLPDLRVTSLTVEPINPVRGQPVTVTIVVRNVGGGTAGPFWVDLYDNPSPPPTRANQRFDQLCSGAPQDCYGIAWYVSAGLNTGQSVMLSSLGGYMSDHSRWVGYFAHSGNHDIYAFADSWNYPVWYGAVLEHNEGLDNRYGPVSVNVTPSADEWSTETGEWNIPLPQRPSQP
jgi:uncharacterized repeat protein (TIGR01451 family)